MKNKTCIIGRGEIGHSLGNVLEEAYDVEYLDIDPDRTTVSVEAYYVINICIPCKDKNEFIKDVKGYIDEYKPDLCIIHSTVPPGTTDACGDICVHSPVHGKHPTREEGIETFTKYIGGSNIYRTHDAKRYLEEAGKETVIVSSTKA